MKKTLIILSIVGIFLTTITLVDAFLTDHYAFDGEQTAIIEDVRIVVNPMSTSNQINAYINFRGKDYVATMSANDGYVLFNVHKGVNEYAPLYARIKYCRSFSPREVELKEYGLCMRYGSIGECEKIEWLPVGSK